MQRDSEILARIEERLIALDAKVDRYIRDKKSESHGRDRILSGLRTDLSNHAERLAKNDAEHKWAGALMTMGLGTVAAWAKTKI